MTVSEKEIQVRIATSTKRYEKLKAARETTKKEQKEASEWLKTEKVELLYLDIAFINSQHCTVNTTITVGCQIFAVDEENNVELQIAYTILSPDDQFSKPAAHLLIANRLQGINKDCGYQFITTISHRVAKIYTKLRQAMELKIRYEILTRPDIMPRWLTTGIGRELKLYGDWMRYS